jgi:hypothetical protein
MGGAGYILNDTCSTMMRKQMLMVVNITTRTSHYESVHYGRYGFYTQWQVVVNIPSPAADSTSTPATATFSWSRWASRA